MIQLRRLGPEDEAAFMQGLKDWEGDSSWHSFCWKEGMKYSDMLEILRKETAGIDLLPGRVPHSMLYGFLGNEIVGRVSIRHELNEKLRYRGGHIGYAVAPRFRRRGYAIAMVKQALDYCRELGLKEIMVTCGDENTASWKVIEYFQGRLQDKIWDDEDEEMIRRYWISL